MKLFICTLIVLFSPLGFAADLSIEEVENISLEKPMIFYWESERPKVKDVALVVAFVGKEKAQVREAYETVFFIDDRVAEKVKDLGDGRVVLIAPQGVSKDSVLWVGPEMLPENIDKKVRAQSFAKLLREDPVAAKSVARAKQNMTFGVGPKTDLPKPVLGVKDLYKKANSIQ